MTKDQMDVPAVNANRFTINCDATVRIAFGEAFGGDLSTERVRGAFVASRGDAKALAEAILEGLKASEPK